MNLTKYFKQSLEHSDEYETAISLVKRLSKGKVWLVGSRVYQGVASELYQASMPSSDFDFIVEDFEDTKVPGWSFTVNKFGNPKYTKGIVSVDIVPLNNIFSISEQDLKPSIENFLLGVPLDIEALVYDVTQDKVFGDPAIKSIESRSVSVNNLEQARKFANRHKMKINEYITERASQLNFKPILVRDL